MAKRVICLLNNGIVFFVYNRVRLLNMILRRKKSTSLAGTSDSQPSSAYSCFRDVLLCVPRAARTAEY